MATTARECSPGPTYSPRLRALPHHHPPLGAAAAPSSRRAGRPARRPLGRPACPGSPAARGGPFWRAASQPSARGPGPPRTPPQGSRRADSTWSLRAPPGNASPRKGGGGERREKGRAGAGPKEGGGKDAKEQKGGEERGGRRKRREGGGSSHAWTLYWAQPSEPSPIQGPGSAKPHPPAACPRAGFQARGALRLEAPQKPRLVPWERKGLGTCTGVGVGWARSVLKHPAPPPSLFQTRTLGFPN